MASRQQYNLSSSQYQLLSSARTNMINACSEFLDSFFIEGDTSITINKEEEKNKKEDFLNDE